MKKVISLLLAVLLVMMSVGNVLAEEETNTVSVRVVRMKGARYYGDTAMLMASVQNAEVSDDIRWEISAGYVLNGTENWQVAGYGERFSVKLTWEIVNSGFRCVLPTGEVSGVYVFNGITEAPAEEVPAEITEEVTVETETEEITEEVVEEIIEEVTIEEAVEEIIEEVTVEEAIEEITEEETIEEAVEEIIEEVTIEEDATEEIIEEVTIEAEEITEEEIIAEITEDETEVAEVVIEEIPEEDTADETETEEPAVENMTEELKTEKENAEEKKIITAEGETLEDIQAKGTLMQSVYDVLDPNRHIDLYIIYGKEMVTAGDTIRIVAVLYGYENVEYTLQWQETGDNGKTWFDIPNATTNEYAFILSSDNYDHLWRIWVEFPDEVPAEQ